MRLIDADALLDFTSDMEVEGHTMFDRGVQSAIDKLFPKFIDAQITVEAEPTVHAHWVLLPDLALCECSRCGRRELHYEDGPAPSEAYPYCHCGAKMDGGELE